MLDILFLTYYLLPNTSYLIHLTHDSLLITLLITCELLLRKCDQLRYTVYLLLISITGYFFTKLIAIPCYFLSWAWASHCAWPGFALTWAWSGPGPGPGLAWGWALAWPGLALGQPVALGPGLRLGVALDLGLANALGLDLAIALGLGLALGSVWAWLGLVLELGLVWAWSGRGLDLPFGLGPVVFCLCYFLLLSSYYCFSFLVLSYDS